MTRHRVVYDFTLCQPLPPILVLECGLPTPLADRIERIAREWANDDPDPFSLQIELMEIADEVRVRMGELAILQRPKRTAMASWRRMIRAMKG